jgi:microcystin-dependent protein
VVNPRTVNVGIIVPLTGADVDTWGEDDVNPNMVSLDGLIGGRQNISVTNVPITLTSPAGFTPTPGSGPTQAENKYLAFTGTMTGNVRVTLPLPGHYIIDNQTTGAFVLSFQGATATEVIGAPPGAVFSVFNDGERVRFVDLGKPGDQEEWAGLTAMPAWVAACTVRPYLLNDGGVYNISDYPILGARFGSTFGGNGLTTFAVPDRRGRVSLPYDGTGTRITTAGCGINGQTLGASLDQQTVTLGTPNLPPYTPSGTNSGSSASVSGGLNLPATGGAIGNVLPAGGSGSRVPDSNSTWSSVSSLQVGAQTFAGAAQGGTSTPINNVQPSIVTGVSVTKT